MSGDTVARVAVTPEAAELFRSLRAQHGPLMVHQSGGCCDGSSPMCYPAGEFQTGPSDVLLGTIDIGSDGAAEPVERDKFGIAAIAREDVDIFDRDVQLVAAGIFQRHAGMRRAKGGDRLDPQIAPDAMFDMHHQIAR